MLGNATRRSSGARVALDVSSLFWTDRPYAGVPQITRQLLHAYRSMPDLTLIPFAIRAWAGSSRPSPHGAATLGGDSVHMLGSGDPLPACDVAHFTFDFEPGLVHGTTVPVLTVYDLRRLLHPGLSRGSAERLLASVRHCVASNGRIHVLSESVAAEVLACADIDRRRISVARPVADVPSQRQPVDGLAPGAFALLLGSEALSKNHLEVLAAWQLLSRAARPAGQLVLAGARGSASDAIDSFIARGSLRDVIRLGEVDSASRSWLLANAGCLVEMSIHEGVGLPPIEAAALGTPVIASDIQPHREFLEGKATFARIGDLAGLAAGIDRHLAADRAHAGVGTTTASRDAASLAVELGRLVAACLDGRLL